MNPAHARDALDSMLAGMFVYDAPVKRTNAAKAHICARPNAARPAVRELLVPRLAVEGPVKLGKLPRRDKTRTRDLLNLLARREAACGEAKELRNDIWWAESRDPLFEGLPRAPAAYVERLHARLDWWIDELDDINEAIHNNPSNNFAVWPPMSGALVADYEQGAVASTLNKNAARIASRKYAGSRHKAERAHALMKDASMEEASVVEEGR